MNAIHNVVAMDYCVEIHRVYWMLLRLLYVYMFTVTKTRDKGYGLFATVDIPAGSVVVEYVGEVIRHKEANKRLEASDMVYILEIREQYT
ncbi:histone H3 [Blastocystis sp. subtype 4]|uniref:histone H3 n=1 Tax=Blastocystis sp. subtype 4 TaxID=944170 RepID=UPI000711CB3C|nr:histone H3 [Blastocystis sp. subtype 4]KNB41879.1 histone H3 [Blastocystis sp. subtype 4]|eukprot:XP_014525322.1 histone H3 [Blastocystis sp. subtype 4]